MKKIVILTILMLIPAFIVALIVRSSFTEKDDLDYYVVATADEELMKTYYDSFKTVEDNCCYILKIKCVSDVKFIFKQTYQEGEVVEIFKGNNKINIGDKINIMPASSRIYIDDNSVNMGFVNAMQEEKEYLVFLGEKLTSVELSMDMYPTEEALFTTLFSYTDIPNEVFKSGYVNYGEVKEFEVFVTSTNAIDLFLELKMSLIEKYN